MEFAYSFSSQPQANVAAFIESGSITFNMLQGQHDKTTNHENISGKHNYENIQGHASNTHLKMPIFQISQP
jgi:hypothetical protein